MAGCLKTLLDKTYILYLFILCLQEGKKKGREYGDEFSRVIAKAVKDITRTADAKTRGSVGRLVKIWEERRVFGSSLIKSLKDLLARADGAPAAAAAPAAAKPAAASGSGSAAGDDAAQRKLQVREAHAVGSMPHAERATATGVHSSSGCCMP